MRGLVNLLAQCDARARRVPWTRRHSPNKSGGQRKYLYALATALAVLAVVQASPAAAAPRAAAAAPRACPLTSLGGAKVGVLDGDPGITYSVLGARYAEVPRIAYKLTGRFPHAAAYTLLAQDDYTFIPGSPGVLPAPAPSAAYTLRDSQIKPDRGSVNPFRTGNQINAPNRNYTHSALARQRPSPAGTQGTSFCFRRGLQHRSTSNSVVGRPSPIPDAAGLFGAAESANGSGSQHLTPQRGYSMPGERHYGC